MIFKNYVIGFILFILFFLMLSILLILTPKLEKFGVLYICAMFALLAKLAKNNFEENNFEQFFILWSHILMFLCFIITSYLIINLGGIINTAFSVILTFPIIFFFFGFVVENKYKGYISQISIIRYCVIFIYILTILTFDLQIFGISYNNPLLNFQNNELPNIINSLEFQRTSLILFLLSIPISVSPFLKIFRSKIF